MILLKWISENEDVNVWIRLIQIGIGFWEYSKVFRLHKRRRLSWLAERQLMYREILCSMESITNTIIILVSDLSTICSFFSLVQLFYSLTHIRTLSTDFPSQIPALTTPSQYHTLLQPLTHQVNQLSKYRSLQIINHSQNLLTEAVSD
jgi:hypothetical protein